jgi:hypothetical protein
MCAILGSVVYIVFSFVILTPIKAISWSSHCNYMIILSETLLGDVSFSTALPGIALSLNMFVTIYSSPRIEWRCSRNLLP